VEGSDVPLILPEDLWDPRRLRSKTRLILRRFSVRPSRRKGQNFTVSPRYLRSFYNAVNTLEPPPRYTLEIGTGIGVLSIAVSLALRGATLITVEVDKRLFEAASRAAGHFDSIVFVWGDGVWILERSCIPLVVSSTPFSASSSIVLAAARNNCVKQAVLGVQREVADRLLAQPGSGDYGRLSVAAQLFFNIRRLSNHSPREFWPPPEVGASIILLERARLYEEGFHRFLEEFTSCLFTQRNRRLSKVLAHCSRIRGWGECTRRVLSGVGDVRVRDLAPREVEELARVVYECRS